MIRFRGRKILSALKYLYKSVLWLLVPLILIMALIVTLTILLFKNMNNVFRLAWRNMWRNRRRTMIIGSSVMFSSLFCILMTSFVDGSSNYIIDQTVEQQTGMLQIQNPDYWGDKRVDNFMFATEALLRECEQDETVSHIAPRIESFAIAWNGGKTRNISLQGVDPAREKRFSKLDEKLLQGEYLGENDDRVLVGRRMAEIMKLSVGDTLTLIGQGYHGESANGLFVVGGIVKAIDPTLDAGVAYMALPAAQNFISMPEGATYIAITLKNKSQLDRTISKFEQKYPKYAFKNWKELIGDTMAGAANDKKQMMTYIYFLYLIVGFGLLSTIIMLTNERRREFGVMMAIGTRRGTIIRSLFVEITMVAMIALGISIAVSLPIIVWLHYYPLSLGGTMGAAMKDMGLENIIPFDLTAQLFLSQILVVVVILIIVMLYPLGKIRSMKVINSLRD